MYLFFILYIFILPKVTGVVSEEYKDKTEKVDKTVFNIERRFSQNLNDDQWHVSHLKDSDFENNHKCKEETFEDKARRYRKMLKNDGALVDYVFAEPLPFDISDLGQGMCRVGDEVGNGTVVPTNSTKTNNLKLENQELNLKTDDNKTGTHDQPKKDKPAEINVATTVKGKATLSENIMDENANVKKSRRNNEYMFSSAEYYDETPEFDDSQCLGVVDVIHLDVDQLRRYDVECELLLEWRSLE